MDKTRKAVYLEVFLISLATLVFESTLLRIFAISEWYHFAFISVSIALLGFGASGTYLSISKRTIPGGVASLLFSIGILISYIVINLIPFDSYRIAWEKIQILYLLIYYLSLSLPFFFCGLCVGLAIVSHPEDVNKTYFINLTGSASGCLIAILFLSCLEPLQIMLVIYLTGILSAITGLLSAGHKILRYISFCCLIPAVYILLAPPPSLKILRISPYKDFSIVSHYPGARILDSKFNAFSRIDIIQAPGIKYAAGLSSIWRKPVPEQTGITIDGNNLSGIMKKIPDRTFLNSISTALPYKIAHRRDVLILEPYTGLDVMVGIAQGAESITVVEKNPLIAKLVKKYSEVYNSQKISLVHEHPRSFLKRRKRNFELIQVSLSDSFRANFASSYSLNENYIYTVEAISEYFAHLSPDGILALHRWLQFPPSEELKLLSAICNSIPAPARKVLAIRTWRTCLILVKKTGLTPVEIQKASLFCHKNKFDFIYFPGITQTETGLYTRFKEDPYYEGFREILLGNREKFYRDYMYEVRASTDNKPFFFHYFKWQNLPVILKTLGKTMQPFGGGGYLLLFALLAFAIIIGAIFIILPLKMTLLNSLPPTYPGHLIFYFLFLGLGFIFVEIPMISKFILFLELPVYAFTFISFTLLFFSGLGSFFSTGWSIKGCKYLLFLLGGLIFVLHFLISPSFLLSCTFPVRVLLSISLLAPVAFLMGIPFPLGIKIVNEQAPGMIPRVWAANGYASVIASVLATILCLSTGFIPVLFIAGAFYLLAGIIIFKK